MPEGLLCPVLLQPPASACSKPPFSDARMVHLEPSAVWPYSAPDRIGGPLATCRSLVWPSGSMIASRVIEPCACYLHLPGQGAILRSERTGHQIGGVRRNFHALCCPARHRSADGLVSTTLGLARDSEEARSKSTCTILLPRRSLRWESAATTSTSSGDNIILAVATDGSLSADSTESTTEPG